MFREVERDIFERFDSLDLYLVATSKLKGESASVAKGLAFVQMYAIYEYTVCTVVQTAIDSIKDQKIPLVALKPSLMALFLDAELKSLKDSGRKREWECRIELFQRAYSNDCPSLDNSILPTDSSHFRPSHLQIIFQVFGIKHLPVRRKAHLTRISEVVNNRNAVAHGRETASEVGGRYTQKDLRHRAAQMKSVCRYLVSVFDGYTSTPERFMKRPEKKEQVATR